MRRTAERGAGSPADLGGGVQLSCLTQDRPLNSPAAEPEGNATRTQGSKHLVRVVHPGILLLVEPPSCSIPSDLTVGGAEILSHETDDCLAKIDPGGRQVSPAAPSRIPKSFSIEVTSPDYDLGRAMSAPSSTLEHAAKVSIRTLCPPLLLRLRSWPPGFQFFRDKVLGAFLYLIIQHAAWLYV